MQPTPFVAGRVTRQSETQRIAASKADESRPWLLIASVAAALGGLSLVPLFALPSQEATTLSSLTHLAALVTAIVCMTRSALAGDRAMRGSRLLLASALGASAAGAAIGLVYVLVHGSIPVPSLVDPVTMLWVLFAARGLWIVPTRDGDLRSKQRLLADGAVAGSALLFASWVAVLEPIAASARWSPAGLFVQIAYPILDIFIAAMVLSLLPRVRADLRKFFSCVALGLFLIAVADSGSAVTLAATGSVRFGWPDILLQAGLVALVVATLVRPGQVTISTRRESERDRSLPFVPVVIAMGVGVAKIANSGALELDDALLGVVMMVSVIARSMLFTREVVLASDEHRHAAAHDELTGLGNRKAFLAWLGEHTSTPGAAPAAVLLADLDGFKEVNDTFGHECGDSVLRAFSAALLSAAGPHRAARLGGDEFAVLVVDAEPEQAARVLAEQLDSLRMPRVSGVAVACSVGIAGIRPGDGTADTLRRADLAMYNAKGGGAGRVSTFRDEMAAESDRRNLLIAQLPGAVGRGEMRLVYQPLYRLGDGTLAGAEALLRWTHPLFGVVAPDEFIPLAEDTGDIRAIGSWVLETAVAQLAEWLGTGRELPQLFINVAAAQFTDCLAPEVAATLARHGIPANRLTLEITETQLPGLAVNHSMQQLRRSGVHVALDDFGSGYSSLAQLARLPVDVLKIDRDFIRNLDVSCGRPVMDAVVSLAKALGLTTVAEGIEEQSQAAEVTEAGVDYAQGYLFSRPVHPDDLFETLPRESPLGAKVVPLPRDRGESAASPPLAPEQAGASRRQVV